MPRRADDPAAGCENMPRQVSLHAVDHGPGNSIDASDDDRAALDLARRLDPKFAPAWERYSDRERIALARYFLPHASQRSVLEPTRPAVIKWYCPFAHQHAFASGHRYCINVYTGCAHRCVYCYAVGYSPETHHVKRDFERSLARDLEDLERFDVPAAPVHLSNSTDPFQRELEERFGHTRHALAGLLAHRGRFTTVSILTKNPPLAARPPYLDLLQRLGELPPGHPAAARLADLPAAVVEVSLAFWREEARSAYDPGAPTVQERIDGIRALRAGGIPVVLRIDPLFPRSPLQSASGRTLQDLGLPEAQTLDDLDRLVELAVDMDALHVVYSSLKIVQPRGRSKAPIMQALLRAFEIVAAPAKPVWRGGSHRLPDDVAAIHVVEPFLAICRRHGVTAKPCMRNLVETP